MLQNLSVQWRAASNAINPIPILTSGVDNVLMLSTWLISIKLALITLCPATKTLIFTWLSNKSSEEKQPSLQRNAQTRLLTLMTGALVLTARQMSISTFSTRDAKSVPTVKLTWRPWKAANNSSTSLKSLLSLKQTWKATPITLLRLTNKLKCKSKRKIRINNVPIQLHTEPSMDASNAKTQIHILTSRNLCVQAPRNSLTSVASETSTFWAREKTWFLTKIIKTTLNFTVKA